ncbi:MAG: hypothetical protein AAFQ15_04890, partial [Pseudomonadota bacterium]
MIVKTPITRVLRVALFGGTALSLAACVDGLQTPFGQARLAAEPEAAAPAAPQQSVASGQEVEAPDVFYASETGLWDGRPSLGGVWVAHPDVVDPERVLIRNAETGQTVTGALFRRERDNPGPDLMVSSDAANAINVIAGTPTSLEIVALRRAPEPEPLNIAVPPPEPASEPALGEADPDTLLAGADIASETLDAAPEALDDSAGAIAAMATAALDATDAGAPDPAADPDADPLELAAAVVTRAQTAHTAIPEAALATSRVLALPQTAELGTPEAFNPDTDLEGVSNAAASVAPPAFEVSSLALEEDTAQSAPTARPQASAAETDERLDR